MGKEILELGIDTEKGHNAWKDVPNASEWLEDLRGNEYAKEAAADFENPSQEILKQDYEDAN